MRQPISLFALTLSVAGLATFDVANAQAAKKLFFEGDLVRGAQQGAPGPFCVRSNQFKRLEKVVWRIRVLDQSGQSLDEKGLKSLVVELSDAASEGRSNDHSQECRRAFCHATHRLHGKDQWVSASRRP